MCPPDVHRDDIIAGLEHLGLRGRSVVVHSSLSSFGRVADGADAVVDALTDVCRTVIAPTFTFSPAARVPPDDHVERNGADYDEDPCGSDHPTPFTPDLPVAREMGIVPEVLRRRPTAVRSSHPLVSFAAIGPDARSYVADHDWNAPQLPLQRLLDNDGHVLLLGTTFTTCTAMHLAEEMAGRRPFIRWAAVDGVGVRRVRVGGCSAGFDAIEPFVSDVSETQIGRARVRAIPMRAVIDVTIGRIQESPQSLICSGRCHRCLDAAAGGPLE